ncbi:MAG: TlpA family protein disulfide reductase [Pleurocapsa sp. SU_196_0]|nr:TlpA family protein disulfide reductase [Pleurocapsa sp. SU_196_0]
MGIRQGQNPTPRASSRTRDLVMTWVNKYRLTLGVGLAIASLVAGLLMPNPDPTTDRSQAGTRVPSLSFADLEGQPRRLEDFTGRVLILNFFASWCAPCHTEAPILESWLETNPNRVQVLGVALRDSKAKLRDFMTRYGLTFPVTMTTKEADLARAFNVVGIPRTVFISKEGRVVSQVIGPLTRQTLEARVVEAERAELPGR